MAGRTRHEVPSPRGAGGRAVCDGRCRVDDVTGRGGGEQETAEAGVQEDG